MNKCVVTASVFAAFALLAEGGGTEGRRGARSPGRSEEPRAAPGEQRAPAQPGAPDVVQEGIKALRGIFGR